MSQRESDDASSIKAAPSPYALMTAILNRRLDDARDLIARGADVNFVDAFGDSAMRLAVRMGLDPIIGLLLAAGARDEERQHWESFRPQAALNDAVRKEDREAVAHLLDSGCDPNRPDDRGMTPLYWAVEDNLPQIVELLLDRGADPNAAMSGRTPLVNAIEAEALNATDLRHDQDFRTTLIALLLDKGADPNAASEGVTPLEFAKRCGHIPAVELLRARGARI